MTSSSTDQQILKDSHIPYYIQLKQKLRAQIRSLQPHTPLSSEEELQRKYDVSRTVVRQALADMVNEGLIYRVKGKGSYVAPPKILEGQIQRLSSFYDEMVARGYDPVTLVLTQEVVEADARISERLDLPLGAPALHLERLRLLNGEPFVLVTTYLPYDLVPGMQGISLSNQSMYRIMEQHFQLTVERSSRTLDAVSADAAEARLLGVKTGQPLLRLEVLSFLANGRPMEYSMALHRGDRARFAFEVGRSDAWKNQGV